MRGHRLQRLAPLAGTRHPAHRTLPGDPGFPASFTEFQAFENHAGIADGRAAALARYLRFGGFPALHQLEADETVRDWKSGNFWVGKLVERPEIMTQGETLEELEKNMRDAFMLMTMDDVPAP